ncbi:hypothetical protein H206_06629 [Candidatus Electrothrix aarhusensis]|uniref:Uncharacterized protein n=1 Tax=Candidatus Electrothrix aarhusensis TaxID=1859131 RepID=A0A444J279_9BACT|nr:hypothetical protein H206_06629 [Candidatus Electrothrix aarhusensis]
MFFYNVIKLATIAQWTFRLIYRPCFVKRNTYCTICSSGMS